MSGAVFYRQAGPPQATTASSDYVPLLLTDSSMCHTRRCTKIMFRQKQKQKIYIQSMTYPQIYIAQLRVGAH